MGMNWISIAEQLRAIGVTVPGTPILSGEIIEPSEAVTAQCLDHDDAFNRPPSAIDHNDTVACVLKAAKAAGVSFFERVADGELVTARTQSNRTPASLRAGGQSCRNPVCPSSRRTRSIRRAPEEARCRSGLHR